MSQTLNKNDVVHGFSNQLNESSQNKCANWVMHKIIQIDLSLLT